MTLDPLAGEEECLPPPVKPWCVSYGMTEVERKEKEITCKKNRQINEILWTFFFFFFAVVASRNMMCVKHE